MADQNTREKLVESARELFHLQGYQPTGIAQILKHSGVNSGSLYYYFPTKEDLLVAVLEWYRDHIQDGLIEMHTATIDDPIEKVFGLLDGYRQMLLVFDYTLGCPIGAIALEIASTHPMALELVKVNFDQWISVIEGFLNQAADRFPADTDLHQLTIHILSCMEGGLMLSRTYRNTHHFDATVSQLRLTIDTLIEQGTNWK